jgi:hypothetical protein
MITILKGFIAYGTHKTKGDLYFSPSRQKWVNDVKKLRASDVLSTPTVPIVNPKKTLKKMIEVGVTKVEINVEDV